MVGRHAFLLARSAELLGEHLGTGQPAADDLDGLGVELACPVEYASLARVAGNLARSERPEG